MLLQLPPDLTADAPALEATLAAFPPGVRLAVEPRHDSWWTGEVREVLTRHDAALVWADRDEQPVAPLWRTAGFGYLRLHHGLAEPWPGYTRPGLQAWVERIAAAYPDDADVFVYFNNDPGEAAVRDAAEFAELARAAGRTVTRTPPVSGPLGPAAR